MAAGYIDLPGNQSTTYTFFLESDDGSLLTIDGKKGAADPGASAALSAFTLVVSQRHAGPSNMAGELRLLLPPSRIGLKPTSDRLGPLQPSMQSVHHRYGPT